MSDEPDPSATRAAPAQPQPPPPRQRFELWNAKQRGVIVALLCGILLYLTIRLILNPIYVSDPQPRDPPRALELADKIDPNTADWPTLAALPMIGERRAKDIIAYRQRVAAQNPGNVAFTRLEDLLRIKGIGPSLIEHLRPYLMFPAPERPAPATQP